MNLATIFRQLAIHATRQEENTGIAMAGHHEQPTTADADNDKKPDPNAKVAKLQLVGVSIAVPKTVAPRALCVETAS